MNIDTDSQKRSPWQRLTWQTSLRWCCIETLTSTCKGPMMQQSKGLGPAKLEASLGQRWIKVHTAEKRWPYTCIQTPEWEVRKELRPWGRQIRRKKCDDVGCHIWRWKTQLVHINGNLSAARHRDEVLTPHMLPAMDLRREVIQHDNARPHTPRVTVNFLANHSVTLLPWPFKSLDLNPIEHLRMTWIDACAVVNQRRKLYKNCSRLLIKNGGEFHKTVFVDWSSLCRDRSVLCYRLMVGTTDIDFEVMSSEHYGL
jgi:hypothetical protein